MFGLLPSEEVLRANTFDLMVVDVLAAYDEYEMTKAQGAKADPDKLTNFYSEDTLKEMVERSREQNK